MTYNQVTVTGQALYGNGLGEPVNVTISPVSPSYFDTVNSVMVYPATVQVTSASDGTWSLAGVVDPTPSGTGLAWNLLITDKGTGLVIFQKHVMVEYRLGASQGFLALPLAP